MQDCLGTAAKPPAVFWYDSGDPPQAGARCGAPNEILRRLGARNIFADTPGSWAPVSWEAVIARNPGRHRPRECVVVDCRSEAHAVALEPGTGRHRGPQTEAHRRDRFLVHDTRDQGNVAAVRKLAEALYPDRFR